MTNKAWFPVNCALWLIGVAALKVLSQLTTHVWEDVCSQPSSWLPGCCPGIKKQGDAVVGCMGLGVSPATHLLLQSMQEVNCLWNTFCLVIAGSSRVVGRSYKETWMQTGTVTAGVLLLSSLCHSPDSNSSIFMRKGFCWWWWCLVKMINLKINPGLPESNCKSGGWKPNVSEHHLCYKSLYGLYSALLVCKLFMD